MPEYFLDVEYKGLKFINDALNFKEFECCTFSCCNFSYCNFIDVTFIDCIFNNCIFSGARINYVALRTVFFNQCEVKDVNFAMCNKLIFDVHFKDCNLDFSKFYALKIKGTLFDKCSLLAVDFMNTDISEVVFDNCDLHRSEFSGANASKSNFKTSYNYNINPAKTKINKAVFSLENLKGLLFIHDIIVTTNGHVK